MKVLIQITYWILVVLSCAALSHMRQPLTDMLSNFYLHFTAIGTLLFFFGLHWRLPRTALVSVAIATICFGLAFSYDRVSVVKGEAAASAQGPLYRVMTFNAWEQAKTMDRLKVFLREQKPDFVILQEITLKDWRALQDLRDLYPHGAYCDDWLCGVALLSRHPWDRVQARNFGPHKLPLITANFPGQFDGLTLYATHTARPHWKYSTQREQLEHLAKSLKETARVPTIVGGDMNASVSSALLGDFASGSGLKSAGNFTLTWPQRLRLTGNLWLPILQLDIDHFFVKPGMTVLRKWRGPDLGSDHRPLLMEFRL